MVVVPVTTNDDVTIWWAPEGPTEAPVGGTPLLLIQGLGYTADMWHRILPGLSAPRRTIRMDNRGVGRSSVPEPPWTVEEMAADAVNALDDAGVVRAHVLGVSMGGLIAQEIALRFPGRVEKLVLGCTHPGGSDAVRMDPAAATMLMDRTPKTARETIEASIPFIYAETTSRDDIERDISARVRYALRATSYWGQLDAMRNHSGTLSRLPEITAPTLVIHGTADRLVQPGNADLIAKAIPGARLEWLEGAGHVFWTDQPQRSIAVMNDFLAD
jgi:pimeloyl-ACP methyl ester carboxylesterase